MNSNHSLQELNDLFAKPANADQKAWDLIYDFYHIILTCMENKNISRSDLSKKLGKSRAAISKMLNKTPNITVKKMVQLADAVGVDLKLEAIDQSKDDEKENPIQVNLEIFCINEYHAKNVNNREKDLFPISSESISAKTGGTI